MTTAGNREQGERHTETGMTGDHHSEYDLIIIGGGPVGMALALALRDSDMSVLLLEARGLPAKTEDSRPLALSHGSRLILQRLGVWKALHDITPITTIHISNRGGFGRAVLTAAEIGVPALGYVMNHHDVFRAMHEALQECDVDYLTGAQVTHLETGAARGQIEFQHDGVAKKAMARLLVLADGGRLTAQIEGVTQHVHDYEQWAVVARVRTERFAYSAITSSARPMLTAVRGLTTRYSARRALAANPLRGLSPAWRTSVSLPRVQWRCCLRGNIFPWYGLCRPQPPRKSWRWMTPRFSLVYIATLVIASVNLPKRANGRVFLCR